MKSPLGIDAQLPVMDLLNEAFGSIYQNRVELFKILGPALVLMVGLDLALNLFFAPTPEELEAMKQAQESGEMVDLSQIIKGSSTAMLLSFASAFIGVLYATSIHKFTLLPKETPIKSALRFWGMAELKYLLRSILIFIISGFAASLIFMFLMLVFGEKNAWIGGIVSIMLCIYWISRLSIILPETALNKPSSLKRAWQMSQGNGSRMVLVVAVIPICLSIPFILLNQLDIPLISVISSIGVYFSTLVSLTTLSLSYQFLLEFYEPEQTEIIQTNQKSDDESNKIDKNDDGSFDA